MNTQKIVELVENRDYFHVMVDYLYGEEIRTAYFKVKDVQEAIFNFNECCNDKIIRVILDPDLERVFNDCSRADE